ncbi:TPA: DEAD/DEAH box helicase [Candidatus Woesearchaeota archaeon]|nr:DEAD/DEAH box helicase [Candidatus Woesearchaeota archaeon]HII65751.1 DEAD/DEAH box helicase [Candidatus Woesearchaeota archaeon]
MNFEDLKVHPQLVQAVLEMGFTEPTPIQQQCIPEIKKGRDVVGQSGTGSGKTAAFGLPILEQVQPRQGIQALILTPTRELCVQVNDMLNSFGKHLRLRSTAVYGGVGINPQIDALRYAEIVVGTPGRILDHLERRTISFTNVRFFVLDEADKMFEMGFVEDVERIMSQVPRERQTMLFSATVPPTVNALIRKHLRDPVIIKTHIHVDRSLLRQVYYNIPQHDKFSLLVHLLRNKTPGLAMVFCATRSETDVVARNLHMNGVNAMAIHGGLSQSRRLHVLDQLKKEHIDVMVATDVAARGLDVKHISHVYNYDVPKTSDEYVHRIGRTARAGAEGDAVTLLTDRDYENFNNVLRDRTLNVERAEVPSFERVRFMRNSQRGRPFGDRDRHSRGSFSGERREHYGGRGHRGESGDRRGGARTGYGGQHGRSPSHGRSRFSSHSSSHSSHGGHRGE